MEVVVWFVKVVWFVRVVGFVKVVGFVNVDVMFKEAAGTVWFEAIVLAPVAVGRSSKSLPSLRGSLRDDMTPTLSSSCPKQSEECNNNSSSSNNCWW